MIAFHFHSLVSIPIPSALKLDLLTPSWMPFHSSIMDLGHDRLHATVWCNRLGVYCIPDWNVFELVSNRLWLFVVFHIHNTKNDCIFTAMFDVIPRGPCFCNQPHYAVLLNTLTNYGWFPLHSILFLVAWYNLISMHGPLQPLLSFWLCDGSGWTPTVHAGRLHEALTIFKQPRHGWFDFNLMQITFAWTITKTNCMIVWYHIYNLCCTKQGKDDLETSFRHNVLPRIIVWVIWLINCTWRPRCVWQRNCELQPISGVLRQHNRLFIG